MRTLDEASITAAERRALERFVRILESELGRDLRSVWLYGSRARGEPHGSESDVDLLVVAPRERGFADDLRIGGMMDEAAEAEGANPVAFSVHIYPPERVAQRREIGSFFIQEVDRDKIVLWGDP